MSERNWQKDYEGLMSDLRKAHTEIENMRTAVRLAARMDKPTEIEVNNLIRLASLS